MHLGEKLELSDSPVPRSRGARCVAWFVSPTSGQWYQRVRWLRLMGCAVALLVVAYSGAATAVYWFVHHYRGIAAVGFLDVTLPWRRDHFDRARGEHYIAEAQRCRAHGPFTEAYRLAKQGLRLAPRNRDGRLLLVELSLALRQPQAARELLLGGAEIHHDDPVFVERLLRFLLERQEDALVIALGRHHLGASPVNSVAGRHFAFGAATASYLRGNYDQAEDFLRRIPGLAADRGGRLLGIRIERDRGFPALALLQLRQLAADCPHDVEVHRELVAELRRASLGAEARRCSVAFQIAHPDLAGPRIESLQTCYDDHDRDRLATEVARLLSDFARDPPVWLELAAFGANAGDAELVRKVAAHAATRNFSGDSFVFLEVEALLMAHDYPGALQTLDEVRRRAGENFPRLVGDSLEGIAHLGLGEESAARRCLAPVLTAPNVSADYLLAIAQRLTAAQAAEPARKVLARAVEIDPANEAAITRLIELDLTLNCVDDLPGHLERFVTTRRPAPEILRVARQKLGSDLFLYSGRTPSALKSLDDMLAPIH